VAVFLMNFVESWYSILRSSSLVVDILYSQVEKNPCSVVNKHESW
jgi:hypothetical protein